MLSKLRRIQKGITRLVRGIDNKLENPNGWGPIFPLSFMARKHRGKNSLGLAGRTWFLSRIYSIAVINWLFAD